MNVVLQMMVRLNLFRPGLRSYSFSVLFVSLSIAARLFGQSDGFDLPAMDTVYDDRIKSIFLYRSQPDKEAMAIMTMGHGDRLILNFDYLVPSPEELYYRFFHFNKDWKPDDMQQEEYMSGFQENQIYNYKVSSHTHIPFVNYYVDLTSEVFKISGNYLVCVYDRNKNVLFTRRFFLSEGRANAVIRFLDPLDVQKKRTHQSMEVEVQTKDLNISNNGKELFLQVVQNGNPNSMEERSVPNFAFNDKFTFNKPDDLLFPALKEFRFKDIRSIISKTPDILYWDEADGQYHAWLVKDGIRESRPYYTESDLNGRYLILNRDVSNATSASDYAMMHFTLLATEPFEDDVFLFGKFSDWQLKPEFKMEYDESRHAYQGSVLLKMGYYNYMYTLRTSEGKPDTSPLEGDWYETENDYVAFVYYRPFGSRYDRLLFAGQFNSNL